MQEERLGVARILQQEPGRTVALEAGGLVVRKTFHGADSDRQRLLATREFEHMLRFSTALARVENAMCPQPLELVVGAETYVRMERVKGLPMRDELNLSRWDVDAYRRIADILTRALMCYVETFAEPYWDFIFRNMFYDPVDHQVTFIDFGVPELYTPVLDEFSSVQPLEVSLGGMVASSIFESARPKYVTRQREHRQAPALAEAVLRRCQETALPGVLSMDRVMSVARTAYGLASSGGGVLRESWYRFGGPLLANPTVKLDRFAKVAFSGDAR